jgi:hypothetical protein
MPREGQGELEITIPDVEIAQGWLVDDLETIPDCDDALTYLTEAISSISAQLALYDAGKLEREPHWRAKTNTALMWKRHAREAVYRRRAMLASVERRALEWIKNHRAGVWGEAMEKING